MGKPMILLDRDGVLNALVVDPEHGTIDSPLHPDQVELIEGAAEAVACLTGAGYGLAIVTNQPAAAKKKTTRTNLERVHEKILAGVTRLGGRILTSHICFHRAEDGCSCRKPRTGLLEAALAHALGQERKGAWMVGDGVTDIQAGAALGLRTAFLGPRKCDACKIFAACGLAPAGGLTSAKPQAADSVHPSWWGPDLAAFTASLLKVGQAFQPDIDEPCQAGKPDLQGVTP